MNNRCVLPWEKREGSCLLSFTINLSAYIFSSHFFTFLVFVSQLRGLTEQKVKNEEETMFYLTKGSQFRTTASTRMNESSSRSHAVFTIYLERRSLTDEWVYKFLTGESGFYIFPLFSQKESLVIDVNNNIFNQ